MINIRRGSERARGDRGWLQSYFTFSFADYQNPENSGFRALRVMNEDRIAAGKGFGPHAHRDMEILTYVVEGELLHRDSMGGEHVLGPREIQMMSAGTGVVHSEFNASETAAVHVYQIWILPEAEDLEPSYQQVAFKFEDKPGQLRLLAAPEQSRGDALTSIRQDARVYAAELRPGDTIQHPFNPDRYAWLQVVKGDLSINGLPLTEGDAAVASGEAELNITTGATSGGEFLLFDLR